MLKLIPLTYKNLLRNRRRTILTVLSVSISLFLLGILLSVYAGFYHRQESPDQARRLITRHRVSLTQSMPEYYADRIRQINGVQAVSIQDWFGGIYIDDRPEHQFGRFAVEPEEIFKVYGDYEIAPEQYQAFLADRQAIAVGSELQRRLGFEIGDRIIIQGDIYPFDAELTVRAVFTGTDDFQAFFHREYLQESLPEEMKGWAGIFTILTETPEDSPLVAKAVDEMFNNAPEATKTETESAFTLSFVNSIGNIKLFMMSIAGAIVFTIMLVSANTMAMSVRERIREVGVLKTLGFETGAVLGSILIEAVLIASLGGLLGAIGAWGIMQLLAGMFISFFSGFAMPWWGIPTCLATAIVIGLLSSLVPAVSASRTKVVEALRHVG